jgi:hypothetical protein
MRLPWTARAAWRFVTSLLASPSLTILVPTHRHADVAEQVILELPHLAGNLLHDAHTAILMRENGIRRICTRDTDFHQSRSHRSTSISAMIFIFRPRRAALLVCAPYSQLNTRTQPRAGPVSRCWRVSSCGLDVRHQIIEDEITAVRMGDEDCVPLLLGRPDDGNQQ